jgi:glycosyltransferase involved in cell wall biosynthesis
VPYKSPFSGYLSYLKFFGKVSEICKLSKVVIVNSSHHQRYVEQYASNVWRVPSVVDADVYRPGPPRPPGGPVTIGWTGSASTVGNLNLIESPLRALASRPDVRLRFIGVGAPPIPGLDAELRAWRADTEVDDLRGIDIGLLPVPLSEWNKRKFFMKLIQYMPLGIPAVATPLGDNPEVIEVGRTGFLADSDEEWIQHLETLVSDHDLRARMRERSIQLANERYTLQANADRIVAAFRSAVD